MDDNKLIAVVKDPLSPTSHPPMEIFKSYHVRLDSNIFKLQVKGKIATVGVETLIIRTITSREDSDLFLGILSGREMVWEVN